MKADLFLIRVFLIVFLSSIAGISLIASVEENVEAGNALDTAYLYLKLKYYTDWASYTDMPDFASDDAVVVGDSPSDLEQYQNIDLYVFADDNEAFSELWKRNYHGLHYVNKAIDLLENGEMNSRLYAEAKFLRAYFHFEALKCFGTSIPLHDETIPLDLYKTASTKTELFTAIVNDLTGAVGDLPDKLSLEEGEEHRITSGAATALLGKVYLYMASPYFTMGQEYYDQAYAQFLTIINTGIYHLLADYDEIWKIENEFGVESIFEISYETGIEEGIYWSNALGAPGNLDVKADGPRFIDSNDTIYDGWGILHISDDLAEAYNSVADSVRKHGTILAEWQLTEWEVDNLHKPADYTGYFCQKRAPWKDFGGGIAAWGFPTNERIIRYADVLLMAAEAKLKGTSPDEGLVRDMVNLVRSRAQLIDITSSGEQLYEDIKTERRLELGNEAHRFFDLVRWGDAGDVLGAFGFIVGQHEHFTIPAEVDLGSYIPENIEATRRNSLKVYPVPANSEIVIELADGLIHKASLQDLTGRVILNEGSLLLSGYSLDIRNVPPGVYLILINTGDEIATSKVIIE